ncbi:MAG: hypothetical protein NZ805_06295 [Armatimonadetes bacterium]|nr:hypothetical protein [Armatimonadota bacterium]MDW8028596.1 hypothetical protein [Armatimonadota bacterium]
MEWQSCLLASICLLISFSPLASKTQVKPKQVAVISSSGVDNDFRSWGEYDGTLMHLGWKFVKFRNTELSKFFEQASQYDLVLTTSLWNYGDPQDMSKFIPKWQKYLNDGGIVILTDMAYAPMCEWLAHWDKGLFVEYADAFRDLGVEKAILDLSDPSRFLTKPNVVGALNYWAHFRRWGERYKVWAKTKAGTAIGLVTAIGKGILIVTTGWAFSPEMLQNLIVNARLLQSGISVEWLKFPDEMAPGIFKASLIVENLVDSSVNVELRTFLRSKDGKEIATAKSKLIKLPPKGKRTLSVNLPCRVRGEIEAVASYRTERLSEKLEAVHPFRVPPLVDLKLKRSIFVLSDALEIAVKLTPPIGRKAKCTVTIQNERGEIVWQSKPLAKSETLSLPAKGLPTGRYELRANAIVEGKESEEGMALKAFEVASIERPKLLVRVGSKGELLINGEPVFPIGTYHVGAEDLKQVKELGFNCVTGPIYGGEQSELTEGQKNWHDEAHRQGLWVINELSEYIRSGRRNFEQARQVVSWLRVHPATILHYAIDEPLGGGISRDLVKQFCQLIKEVDPEHPTFVNEVPGEVVKYADIADITGTDPYPIGVEVPKSLAWVGLSVRQAVEAAKGRPVWGVIQSHRQPPAHSQNRYPTPEEIRCMAYLALNNGAKGLLFYAWGDIYRDERGEWVSGFKYSKELQKFFRQFNRELAEIGLHYALGQIRRDVIKIEPKDAPLDAVWLEHGDVKMAVVVNTSSSIVKANIITPNAKFEHEFKPFEVKFVR